MKISWPTWTALFFSNVIYVLGNITAGAIPQCNGGFQCDVYQLEQACPRNSTLQDCNFTSCSGTIVLKNWGLKGSLNLTQFKKKITHLDLSNNELSGAITFPDSVEAACPTMGLETLILSNNNIHGEFAFEKLRAKDLRYLELAGNHFVTCNPGQYQLLNSMDCGLCSPGRFTAKLGQLECEECPKGRYQDNWGNVNCKSCPSGRYNPALGAKSVAQCLECDIGSFNDAFGASVCANCSMGQFQNRKGTSKCDVCSFGYFSAKIGATACTKCDKDLYATPNSSTCIECGGNNIPSQERYILTKGEQVCIGDPGQLVALAAFAALVLTCCSGCGCVACVHARVCQRIREKCCNAVEKTGNRCNLIQKARKQRRLLLKMKRWDPPQSKSDAEIAEHFVLPKAANEIKDCIKTFKLMETELIRNRKWNDEQSKSIRFHSETVITYLGGRIDEARQDEEVERLLCCYHDDELVDFQELYGKTMSIIDSREEDGMEKFTDASSRLEKCRLPKCPPNPQSLFALYDSGRGAYDLFHKFLEKAAKHVPGAKCYKKGKKEDKLPGMKGIYRVVEKGMFKYNRDGRVELNLSKVRDLVRGGIIHRKMWGLAEVVNYFAERHKSGEITICRIKDRFSHPSASGWTDMMINFSLADDPGQHVCEVQLIHSKMFIQRTVQEGHTAYNRFRAAQELLITVSRARGAANPFSNEALHELKVKVALDEPIFK